MSYFGFTPPFTFETDADEATVEAAFDQLNDAVAARLLERLVADYDDGGVRLPCQDQDGRVLYALMRTVQRLMRGSTRLDLHVAAEGNDPFFYIVTSDGIETVCVEELMKAAGKG